MGDKDFFLSPDDAMTMGDIDYMRTSKRTRRTFPKTLKNKDGFAFENEVSSMEDRSKGFKGSSNNSNSTTNSTYNFQSQSTPTDVSASTSSNVEQPQSFKPVRKSDSSMDMFRNMAKNIRK